MDRDPVEIGRALIYAALVAVLLERMLAIASDLHLWGDGTWFLLRIASTRDYYFWVGDWRSGLFRSRIFTLLAEQTPLVLATHLRIHSLHILSLIYGTTLYSHALLSLYICYRYAAKRWYMLFPLLSLFAGSMNAEGYICTDSHFLVSLYWPVLFILLFQEELKKGTLLLLLALSIPTVLSYESMMFFGIILAGVCLWRWKTFSHSRTVVAGLAAWYLLGAALALAAFIWPFDPANKSGFVHGLLWIPQSDHLAAKTSILVLSCCAVLLATPSRLAKLWLFPSGIGLAAILYLWVEVLSGRAPVGLDVLVPARILNLVTPLAATALLFAVLFGWFKPDRKAIGLTAILVGALGLGQALWTFGCMTEWQGMLATLRYELLLHEGPVAYEDSVMSRDRLGPLHLSRLHANWPLPLLSIYESGQGEVRSIVSPSVGAYLPVDPLNPSTLPDLSRYRVYYDSYRAALDRNKR